MDDLDVRELRYFVAVAEELNFSRAARRLGMTQPPLSRAIQRLERRIGADLLERNTRGVALTQAGQAMLDEARAALAAVAAVTHRVRRAVQARPELLVTAKPGAATGVLRRITEAYAGLPGTATVQIVVSGYGQQASLVRDGHVDLALVGSPYDVHGLDAEPLTSEPRLAAVPAWHRLAGHPVLRRRDLSGEPVPRWPHQSRAERRYWAGREPEPEQASTETGSTPHETIVDGPLVQDPAQLLDVVGLGQGVALIPQSLAAQNPRADVAYRPVIDATPYITAITWREGSRSRTVAQFVRFAIDLISHSPV